MSTLAVGRLGKGWPLRPPRSLSGRLFSLLLVIAREKASFDLSMYLYGDPGYRC